MPLDELAMCVLTQLAASDPRPAGRYTNRAGQILSWVSEWDRHDGATRTQSEVARARPDLVDALTEAWEWLRGEGFIAPAAAGPSPESIIITRRGREILEYLEPLAMVRAQRRLGVELHPDLADRLRPLTRAGAFEQAAFDALRQVEVRVRELAESPPDSRGQPLRGVPLMRNAFGNKGKLTDPSADAGEQDGLRELFSGAFGAVRNPLGHRNVEWDDATEAAEMVLLADLLMRQLDRVEQRIAATTGDGNGQGEPS